MMAGGTIDLDQIAMPEILDPPQICDLIKLPRRQAARPSPQATDATLSAGNEAIISLGMRDAAECRCRNLLIVRCVCNYGIALTCSDSQEWRNRRTDLSSQTARITEVWRASYGNSLVNFAFPGARQELLNLALRYERKAHQLDERGAPAVPDQEHN
jgi:hypothetical protein